LKWWELTCKWVNSFQIRIGFKCDWWKWLTPCKTWRTKNFNISWNNNGLKWWELKCRWVNSFQFRIGFKGNWFAFCNMRVSESLKWLRNPCSTSGRIRSREMSESPDSAMIDKYARNRK
jgi:hypothetical protein